MHLLVREQRSLDAEAAADDLGQAPAELLLLSFSDSDLGAAATAWSRMGAGRPSLRLASLKRLRHPMSVDLYLEQTVRGSGAVLVRLLGGLEYWRYGAEEIAALCRAEGIPLALLPGDGRDDAALQAMSTVPAPMWQALSSLLEAGGAENAGKALALASGRGTEATPRAVPAAGTFALGDVPGDGWARAAIVFYRSHLLAGDTAPVEALGAALAGKGLEVRAWFVSSLKEAGAAEVLGAALAAWRPAVVLNATAFAAPLPSAGAPVLQVVLAGSDRARWAESVRGLSGSDLAMHAVLPELDGRLLTTAVSFKQAEAQDGALAYARTVHAPEPEGVALAASRAAGWARLAVTPPGERVVALVLSDYPGGGRVGHAVGLDTFASLEAILRALQGAGFDAFPMAPEALVAGLCEAAPEPFMTVAAYRDRFAALPAGLRAAMLAAWGEPEAAGGAFRLRVLRSGRMVMAVQPDRGSALDRKAGYHDPDCPPRHEYVAFYLWLRDVVGAHALVHLGAHGTLEWLPGKSVALSAECAPAALIGGLPVIYPFIVNNPGEAAAAKRRLGAVTIGHLTPPLREASLSGEAAALERALEEYAAADGMDRRRKAVLRRDILTRAGASGLLDESGAAALPDDDRLARLDAYLCDVKDAQVRDGLHVFGASGEMEGLLAALDGRFVPAGPAGAPSRGRADVLPTGRNLYTVDPRLVPTQTAMRLAEKTAAALLRRHLQDCGEPLRRLVLNLWGSATMRTGGEDLALALHLLGVRPEWDAGSGRVVGFEVIPLALMDRPRVDVTLRISGLFRDAFAAPITLFDAAVRAVAARDEAAEWNPLVSAPGPRIYGPPPGCFGAGIDAALESGRWSTRADLGAAFASASAAAYGQRDGAPDPEGFAARARAAEAFVLLQDHAETDILEGTEAATHLGGFAALAASSGADPALYQADTALAEIPVLRTAAEAVVRTVRARAANPSWIAGMMRHGYRGAAEIARSLDALYAHAALLPARFDPQFEALFAATLGDQEVERFLAQANSAARDGMAARFAEARRLGLWQTGRNHLGESFG